MHEGEDIPPDEDGARPSPRPSEPDAHGQAALLLIESVLHALIETKTLTLDQAIEAVQTASDVTMGSVDETDEPKAQRQKSLALLSGIRLSLQTGRRSN